MAASIFDRYGIKEVADVTFYKLNADETQGAPVLYLDTLKVSTIEQTAENTAARGGKGNPKLIMWDYNKEINVTLEDALFSAKSMAMLFGDEDLSDDVAETIDRTFTKSQITIDSASTAEVIKGSLKIAGRDFKFDGTATAGNVVSVKFYDGSGEVTDIDKIKAKDFLYGVAVMKAKTDGATQPTSTARKITINADKFPGTYKVVGDTYARSEANGEDSFFQFVINKAKIMSEVTLTMEAEGDPSTFSMNLQVLRPKNGQMMELIKYDLDENTPSA